MPDELVECATSLLLRDASDPHPVIGEEDQQCWRHFGGRDVASRLYLEARHMNQAVIDFRLPGIILCGGRHGDQKQSEYSHVRSSLSGRVGTPAVRPIRKPESPGW